MLRPLMYGSKYSDQIFWPTFSPPPESKAHAESSWSAVQEYTRRRPQATLVQALSQKKRPKKVYGLL